MNNQTNTKKINSLSTYYLLGRSGLRVSRLCLGTATFGTAWGEGWSISEQEAENIFYTYLDAGGNFVDTADCYQDGESERWVGKFINVRGIRDRVVLATKFAMTMDPSNPNAGGNSKKSMIKACENSLRRLQTDYIDLYYMHHWDTITPVEEMMAAFDELVKSGKVLYVGLCNPPGWYLGRAQTLPEWRGWQKICAIQLEYSLAMRDIEREYVDAALELGIGICPWSPLANGLLTGKYQVTDSQQLEGKGRMTSTWVTDPDVEPKSSRNQRIVDKLVNISEKIGYSPAQIAINWVTNRPGVISTTIGVTLLSQLECNISALEFEIPAEELKELNEISKPDTAYPYVFFNEFTQRTIMGDNTVLKEPSAATRN
ncbi:MAG: aldo/keto reductase [Okeania sp. SIO3I5]|nr:aldo/keto reductase [Okeania sp. SIO3I5]